MIGDRRSPVAGSLAGKFTIDGIASSNPDEVLGTDPERILRRRFRTFQTTITYLLHVSLTSNRRAGKEGIVEDENSNNFNLGLRYLCHY